LTRRIGYHNGLQALRGVLAMAVFCQHLFWQASFVAPGPTDFLYSFNLGAIGVLTFFALSGYLISSKAGDPPMKFVMDRVRRVVPIFWLSIPFAILVLLLRGEPVGGWPWDVAFLIPTGRSTPLPLPHWSLYFEAFFYLLVVVVARLGASWARPAVIVWGVVSLALFTHPYNFLNYTPPNVYNLVFPPFAMLFAAGVVAGWRFTPKPWKALPYAVGAILGFYGWQLLVRFGLWHFLPDVIQRHDLGMEAIAFGSFCAVRAALCWEPAWLPGRVLMWLGDASYGIYIFHMITMALALMVFDRLPLPRTYWVAIAGILALALPPAILAGRLDVRVQQALKQRQISRRPRGGVQVTGTTAPVEADRTA
jgi:exopolysaccharide production protein ExoZ